MFSQRYPPPSNEPSLSLLAILGTPLWTSSVPQLLPPVYLCYLLARELNFFLFLLLLSAISAPGTIVAEGHVLGLRYQDNKGDANGSHALNWLRVLVVLSLSSNLVALKLHGQMDVS